MKLKTTTITQKVVIPASPEEVYDAFMDAKKHSAFTGAKATSDAKVGGEFSAWDGYITGKNLELEKGKRIVQEWITTEWPEGYATVEVGVHVLQGQGRHRIDDGSLQHSCGSGGRVQAGMD